MALVTFHGTRFDWDSSFSNCCGSLYRSDAPEIKPTAPRKWKNQYGEGVIPGKPASIANHNHRGILLLDDFIGSEMSTDTDEVKHLETKNGKITIAIRKVW